jgi:hypothetical protein
MTAMQQYMYKYVEYLSMNMIVECKDIKKNTEKYQAIEIDQL